VDLNVTRHVRPELEQDDWDVAIFHYLGLGKHITCYTCILECSVLQ
jgi:hypothetical protein